MNRTISNLFRPKTTILANHIREKHYKVVIAGAGSGGLGLATRINKEFQPNEVAIIDPAKIHYYQPYFTCVGAGIVNFDKTYQETSSLIPSNFDWIQKKITEFKPASNCLKLDQEEITYDYLVIALGIQLDFNKINGLQEALDNDPRVVTNYSPVYVKKTFEAYKNFEKGQKAVFTFPATPVKCAGAGQKVMYLFDDYLRRNNRRDAASINYHVGGGAIFSVPHYRDILQGIAASRNINVDYFNELIAIDHKKSQMTFLDTQTNTEKQVAYDFAHVTPPMKIPACLSSTKDLCTTEGPAFVSVDKHSLRHVKFSNIFALGDCSSLPTSKTAASASTQVGVVQKNLLRVMKDSKSTDFASYDGYSSCPILTGYNSAIIAEFDYDLKPKETLPFNQGVEKKYLAWIKKFGLSPLYWQLMMRGLWVGPSTVRKYINFRKNLHVTD